MEAVYWKQIFKEWEHDPHKALAWILQRFWEAQITPKDTVTWQIKEKQIIIGTLTKIAKEKTE